MLGLRKTETIREIIIDEVKYRVSGKQVKYLIDTYGKRYARALLKGDAIEDVEEGLLLYIDRVEDSNIVINYDDGEEEYTGIRITRKGTVAL